MPVSMAEYSIGLDLGGTNYRAAASDRGGKLIDKISGPTNSSAGRDVNDLVVLTLGTGIGGGIIIGGRVLHGFVGMAAELGHVTVDPTGTMCACGNTGCREKHALATAVSTMARALGIGLANFVQIFNFPLYLLSGGALAAWDLASDVQRVAAALLCLPQHPDQGRKGDTGQRRRFVRCRISAILGNIISRLINSLRKESHVLAWY
jgi:predicted NBD/HSP70 family sugar kinase